MSELREVMRDRIKSIANDPHIKERYDMYADMVLGDLREALLSDEVVEAAVKSVRAWHGDMMPLAKDPNGNDYGPLDDDDWDILADAILTAALVAMGAVTEEGQGDE